MQRFAGYDLQKAREEKSEEPIVTPHNVSRRHPDLTIESILRSPRISKSSVYEAITGEKYNLGENPTVDITEDDFDTMYQVIERMRKEYAKDDLRDYYAHDFRQFKEAYEQRDLEAFKEAAEDMLISIEWQ